MKIRLPGASSIRDLIDNIVNEKKKHGESSKTAITKNDSHTHVQRRLRNANE